MRIVPSACAAFAPARPVKASVVVSRPASARRAGAAAHDVIARSEIDIENPRKTKNANLRFAHIARQRSKSDTVICAGAKAAASAPGAQQAARAELQRRTH